MRKETGETRETRETRGTRGTRGTKETGETRETRGTRETTTKSGITVLCYLCCPCCPCCLCCPFLSPPQKKIGASCERKLRKGLGRETYIYLLLVDLCSVSEVVPVTITCLECSIKSEITTTIVGYNNCNIGNTSTM